MLFNTPRALARLTFGLAALAVGLLSSPVRAEEGATLVAAAPKASETRVNLPEFASFNAAPAPTAVQDIDRPAFIPRRYPFALRLGATLSPRTRFVGGADVSFPTLSIGPGFYTRLDAEAVIAANFGGVSALVPITIDQIYSKGVLGGRRFYAGIGFGPYFGEVTRFGGKVFIGADVVRNFGGEFTVHFPGYGPAMTALQLRYSL